MPCQIDVRLTRYNVVPACVPRLRISSTLLNLVRNLLFPGLPLHKQAVLDIGCGTGNYAAAVAPHVGSLTCMDGNASMLAKCEVCTDLDTSHC